MGLYYKTKDVWEAIALAEAQNDGRVYDDGVTVRLVSVFGNESAHYYVQRVENVDNLGVAFVDYDTMALDFPPVEI